MMPPCMWMYILWRAQPLRRESASLGCRRLSRAMQRDLCGDGKTGTRAAADAEWILVSAYRGLNHEGVPV